MSRRRLAANVAATLAVVAALIVPGLLHHGSSSGGGDEGRMQCYTHAGVLRDPTQIGVWLKPTLDYQPGADPTRDRQLRFWRWMTPTRWEHLPAAKRVLAVPIYCR